MKILCRQPLQQLQIEHFFKEGQKMYGTITNFYFNSNWKFPQQLHNYILHLYPYFPHVNAVRYHTAKLKFTVITTAVHIRSRPTLKLNSVF